MPQSRPTLDQRRAKHAWETVQEAVRRSGQHAKQDFEKFTAEVRKLPMRIMASGLGQALAFLEAKNDVRGLLEALSDWVRRERGIGSGAHGSLLQAIIHGDAELLRRATDETQAYLQWLKRFVDAEGLGEDREEGRAGG